MDRLEKSSGFKGEVVIVSTGVKPRIMIEEEGGTMRGRASPTASCMSPISVMR
jgi:hypothetical protein